MRKCPTEAVFPLDCSLRGTSSHDRESTVQKREVTDGCHLPSPGRGGSRLVLRPLSALYSVWDPPHTGWHHPRSSWFCPLQSNLSSWADPDVWFLDDCKVSLADNAINILVPYTVQASFWEELMMLSVLVSSLPAPTRNSSTVYTSEVSHIYYLPNGYLSPPLQIYMKWGNLFCR